MSDKLRLAATSTPTGNATIACAECEQNTAAPCFNLDHVAKALGSAATEPNAALIWFKKQFPAMTDENCMPGAAFRRAIFHVALQPVWSSPAGRKSLAEALVRNELLARSIYNLGDCDEERLIEGVDRLIAFVLLKEDSGGLYDPRKGASLKTYVRRVASKRIGGMLSKIKKVTRGESDHAHGDGAAVSAVPLQLRVPATQTLEVAQGQWGRQVSESLYDLREARIREEEIAALVQDWLMRRSKAARTRQEADALSRSGRLMLDIASWRPHLVWPLELEAGQHVHRIPMRVYISQQIAAAQFNHPNGTVLEGLVQRHCLGALRDLLQVSSPRSRSLQQLLDQVRVSRERARSTLIANVEDNHWAALVNVAATKGGLRSVPPEAPALLFHMIPWSDLEPQARGHPGP